MRTAALKDGDAGDLATIVDAACVTVDKACRDFEGSHQYLELNLERKQNSNLF